MNYQVYFLYYGGENLDSQYSLFTFCFNHLNVNYWIRIILTKKVKDKHIFANNLLLLSLSLSFQASNNTFCCIRKQLCVPRVRKKCKKFKHSTQLSSNRVGLAIRLKCFNLIKSIKKMFFCSCAPKTNGH